MIMENFEQILQLIFSSHRFGTGCHLDFYHFIRGNFFLYQINPIKK